MQRSLLVFQNSLKSKETVKAYTWYLDKFKSHNNLKDYDSILELKTEEIQIMVEDYIMHLKSKINPNSMPTFFYPVKAFCEANDIELKWKKILRLFPEKVKKNGREAWTTEDIQSMLKVSRDFKNTAIIHFLASTGCRIGSLADLKMKHLTPIGEGCKSIILYENTRDEQFTFLTPEASNALQKYHHKREADGEVFGPESPVFRSEYVLGIAEAKPSSGDALKQLVNRVVKNAGLRGKADKRAKRYEVPLNNGFRKRFVTLLKMNSKVPNAIVERLVGHKMYHDGMGNMFELDENYMRATKDQLFKFFELAIQDLTISREARQQAEIEVLSKERDKEKDSKLKYDSFLQKVNLEQDTQLKSIREMKRDVDRTLELENRNRKDLDKILEAKQDLNDFVKIIAKHIKTGKRPTTHKFDKQLDQIFDLVSDETNIEENK